jgi:DNA-binding NarL/FixJ family response regulator
MTTDHTREAPAIRVAIVDRQTLVRAGLRLVLAADPRLAVVAEADDCEAALRAVPRRRPDVVVVALEQFGATEIGRLADALAAAGRSGVLALANSDDRATVLRAVRAGALGLVSRYEPIEVVRRAIRGLHDREAWFQRRSIAVVLGALRRAGPDAGLDPEFARLATLTRREREIAALVSTGLKNREVAARLFISEVTVRHHLTHVFEKLGLSRRIELLKVAHRIDVGA